MTRARAVARGTADAAGSRELRLAGYFAKHVRPRPDSIEAPGVIDICSVSTCLSPGPDDWVGRWLHNDLGLFDSPELALQVVPAGAPPTTLFAYRLSTVRFSDGQGGVWAWPRISPAPLSPSYESIGFDAVSKSADSALGFECSPLSCNDLAKEWPVNRHCLFEGLETAMQAARHFSIEKPEPGRYYVAEVLVAR